MKITTLSTQSKSEEFKFGWHFLPNGPKYLNQFGQKRKTLAKRIGGTESIKGDVQLCESGLHASPTIWDAIPYMPNGTYLRYVKGWGSFKTDGTKFVTQHRQIIFEKDIMHELLTCIADAMDEYNEIMTDTKSRTALGTSGYSYGVKYNTSSIRKVIGTAVVPNTIYVETTNCFSGNTDSTWDFSPFKPNKARNCVFGKLFKNKVDLLEAKLVIQAMKHHLTKEDDILNSLAKS